MKNLILKKAGKQTLELCRTTRGKKFVVFDGSNSNWIIIYHDFSWAADHEKINAPIKNFLNKNAEKLSKLQNEK